MTVISSFDESKQQAEDVARQAVQSVIRRYALGAAWPSKKQEFVKNSIMQMAIEIAALFGKSVEDFSVEDLGRAQRSVERVCSKVGLGRIGLRRVRQAVNIFQSVNSVTDYISHVYWIGSVFYGNFGPLVRKFGLKLGGAPLARSTGVWLAGQAISELYFEAAKFNPKRCRDRDFFSLFDSFTLEQYQELAQYMGIDVRLAWDVGRVREEILNQLSSAYHNKLVALWSDVPSYKSLLLSLAEELEIPDYKMTDQEELLEERIVVRVTSESIQKMSAEQLKQYEAAIRKSLGDNYWSDSVKSTLFAGGLLAGRLVGARLFLMASSGLAVVSGGISGGLGATVVSTAAAALSTVVGPVGIVSATAVAAMHWTRPRPRKALPFVLYMAAARGVLMGESQAKTFWGKIREFLMKLLFIGRPRKLVHSSGDELV